MSDKSPEREALEKEATALEVRFAGNIGDEKLRERIEEAKAAQNGSGAANAAAAGGETSPQVTGKDAAPAAAAAPISSGKKAKAKAGSITVIGPKGGFWRAGIRFGAEPQTFEPGALTEAQIALIKGEPKLVVTTIE